MIRTLCFLVAIFLTNKIAFSQIHEFFQKLDVDQDGVLTGEELAPIAPYDEGRDGKMSSDEWVRVWTAFVDNRLLIEKKTFAERDANEDGKLSGLELSGFEYTDLDKNKKVSLEEFLLGSNSIRLPLATMTRESFTKTVHQRFDMLDINKDKKLSGTEKVGIESWDTSGDSKIDSTEFLASMILDSLQPGTLPDGQADDSELQLAVGLVEAINSQSSAQVLKLCRPEFLEIIDERILKRILHHVHEQHGSLDFNADDKHQVTAGEQSGTKHLTFFPKSEKGEVEISITNYEGKMLGIALQSPEIDKFVPALLNALTVNDQQALRPFADEFSPDSKRMIRRILASEDDVALSMFHPSVPQQLGDAPFRNLFARLRDLTGGSKQIELEEAGVDWNPASQAGLFSLTHLVTGSKGKCLVKHEWQIVGLKAYMVSISVVPSE